MLLFLVDELLTEQEFRVGVMSGLFLFHFPHQDDWLLRPVIIDQVFYTVLLPVEYVASDHRKVPPPVSPSNV